jgi:hypothetical protein
VNNGEARQRVALRQRERGAGDFDRLIAGEIADKGPGECRLAGTKIAGQRNDIAWFNDGGNIRHQRICGGFVGDRRRKAVVAGAGGKHRIIRYVSVVL